jgi:ankyrin repeat protein
MFARSVVKTTLCFMLMLVACDALGQETGADDDDGYYASRDSADSSKGSDDDDDGYYASRDSADSSKGSDDDDDGYYASRDSADPSKGRDDDDDGYYASRDSADPSKGSDDDDDDDDAGGIFNVGGVSKRAAKRMALVIGNYNYMVDKMSLPYTIGKDAHDMATKLLQFDFTLYKGKAHINLNREEMAKLLKGFAEEVGSNAGEYKYNPSEHLEDIPVVAIYYSGHGATDPSNNHSLIFPIDYNRTDAKYDSSKSKEIPKGEERREKKREQLIDLHKELLDPLQTRWTERLDELGLVVDDPQEWNRLNALVILDACRDYLSGKSEDDSGYYYERSPVSSSKSGDNDESSANGVSTAVDLPHIDAQFVYAADEGKKAGSALLGTSPLTSSLLQCMEDGADNACLEQPFPDFVSGNCGGAVHVESACADLGCPWFALRAECPTTSAVSDSELFAAVNSGETKKVKHVLDQGVDINTMDPEYGSTPLLEAARSGSSDMIQLLLDRGAKTEMSDVIATTPLLEAARYGNMDAVTALLKARADIEAASNAGNTPLMEAARRGHIDVIKALKNKAKIELTNNDGYTPLLLAAQYGGAAAVQVLVDAGAELEATSVDGSTPLILAAYADQPDNVQLLLDAGADEQAEDSDGKRYRDYMAQDHTTTARLKAAVESTRPAHTPRSKNKSSAVMACTVVVVGVALAVLGLRARQSGRGGADAVLVIGTPKSAEVEVQVQML